MHASRLEPDGPPPEEARPNPPSPHRPTVPCTCGATRPGEHAPTCHHADPWAADARPDPNGDPW